MRNKKKLGAMAVVAAGVLALAACKEVTGPAAAKQSIELPEGQFHIGTQWVGNELWVESADPKEGTCMFAQYKDGKLVAETATTFTNCRVPALPAMRPMMPGGPAMNRPGMNQPGMNRPVVKPQGQTPPSAPGTAMPAGAPKQPAVVPGQPPAPAKPQMPATAPAKAAQ
jgi:hypothetical protein